MKITKLHIENFGKLQNYDIDFSKGITTIYEENGFGKSTLAVFIMSMFYGLNKNSKHDLDENLFNKYNPWQGGVYGGSLCFECERGKFRIERIFGGKGKGSYMLYNTDNGLQSNEFTEKIGDEIFGIDADAFIKSIYIPQRDISSSMPSSIISRLSNTSLDDNDINSYDSAVSKLKNERKIYQLERGQGGKIWDNNNKINQNNYEIERLEDDIKGLPLLEKRIIEIDDEIVKSKEEQSEQNKVRDQLALAEQQQNEVQKKHKIYLEMSKKAELQKEAVAQLKAFFDTKTMPTDTELLKADADYTEYNLYLNEQVEDLTEEEENSLNHYRETFEQGIPNEVEIDITRRAFSNYNASITEKSRLQTDLDRLKNERMQKANGKKQTNKLVILVSALIFLSLALIFGAISVLKENILPLTVLAAAFACFGIGLVTYYLIAKKKDEEVDETAQKSTDEESLEGKLKEHESIITNNEKTVSAFREKYNVSDSDFLSGLMNLNTEKGNYKNLLEKETKIAEKHNKQVEKIKSAKDKLTQFLSVYYKIDDDRQIKALLDNLKIRCSKIKAEEVAYANAFKNLNDFIEQNDIDVTSLSEIVDYTVPLIEAKEKYKNLQDKIIELNKEKINKENKIKDIEAEQQRLINLLDENSRLQADVELFEYHCNIINKTLDMLAKAKENLSMRYLEPIKNGFAKYSDLLLDGGVGEFVLDTNFNVSIIECGQQREIDYFSEGYKSLIDVCLRFALIDALFGNEKPVVILDDPFVNFDDDKLKMAKKMLKLIAEDFQIIYFVCHESRICG